MNFNNFKQWCQNKGFIITLPSGYIQVMGLDGKSFEQFKGFFNLCVLFFQEKTLDTDSEEETLSPDDDAELYKQRNAQIYKTSKRNWCDIGKEQRNKENYENSELKHLVDSVAEKCTDPKYSNEDFEKVFNYLLTPDRSGIIPMDELLDSLEN